jgi:hypothetical protein
VGAGDELKATTSSRAELEVKLRSCRSGVEETKLALSNSRSRGSVLDSLMKARNKGVLPGIQVQALVMLFPLVC